MLQRKEPEKFLRLRSEVSASDYILPEKETAKRRGMKRKLVALLESDEEDIYDSDN